MRVRPAPTTAAGVLAALSAFILSGDTAPTRPAVADLEGAPAVVDLAWPARERTLPPASRSGDRPLPPPEALPPTQPRPAGPPGPGASTSDDPGSPSLLPPSTAAPDPGTATAVPDGAAGATDGTGASEGTGASDGTGTSEGTGAGDGTRAPSAEPTAQPPSGARTPAPPAAPEPAPAPVSGRPGPGTTGVPDGVALRVHEGDLRITTPGAVVEALEIRGFVEVRAPGVTLRHVVVRGRPTDSPRGLVSVTVEGASVTIERSELAPTTPSPWIDGVRGWGITARGVDIHHVIDGFHLYGDDVLIEDSWVHDHVHFENDPHQGGRPSHDDSVQIQRGSNIRIVGNVMSGAYNTGIQFTQDQGTVSDVVISGNHLGGGGCTINLAEKGRGPFRGVVVRDNRFALDTRVPRCAIIAPSTTVIAASGNTFTDGTAARVRSGD